MGSRRASTENRMIIRSWEFLRQNLVKFLVIIIGFALILTLSNPSVSWQAQVGVLAVAFMAALFTVAGEQGLHLHLYLMLLTEAFGWRTAKVGGIILDAQQAVAWLLLFHLLVARSVGKLTVPIRGVKLAFITLWVGMLGFLTGLVYERNISAMITEMGPLLLSIPVIIGLCTLVRDERELQRVAMVLMVVVLLISVPGIIGYVFRLENAVIYRADSGTYRANFPLWGGSVAGYALVPLLILIMPYLLCRPEDRWFYWVAWFSFVIGLVAVLLAGQRGGWIALATGLVGFTFIGRTGRLVVTLALLVTLLIMPDGIRRGLFALTETDVRNAYNSSTMSRYSRATGTMDLVWEHPLLGNGFTASGWAHTDLLQLAANLGIPAALALLIGWYWPTLIILRGMIAHLPKRLIASKSSIFQAGLMGAVIVSIFLLATEAMIVISALVLPIWIVVGLLHSVTLQGDVNLYFWSVYAEESH